MHIKRNRMLKDFLTYKMQEIEEENSSIHSTVTEEILATQMFEGEFSESMPLKCH